MSSEYMYVIYIRGTREKVWEALTSPEFTKRYWMGVSMVSEHVAGSDWKLMIPDGRVADSGKVIEVEWPKRLVVTWKNEFLPELQDEGHTRCTFELEQQGEMVRLSVLHQSELEDSKMIRNVRMGWPVILSSLKSLLETGEPLPGTSEWPKGL